jgi:hypothetical protein
VPADRLSAPVAEAVRARVLQNARRQRETAPISGSIRAQQVINEVFDDLVTMQNGWQLTNLPTESPRAGVRGRAISSSRQFVQRSLHPLPAHQTEFNLAVNRIVTHLLNVTALQAATIERLEAQVDAQSASRSDL